MFLFSKSTKVKVIKLDFTKWVWVYDNYVPLGKPLKLL